MKLATLRDGTPVGRLNVVSRDLKHAAPAAASKTLQQALRTGPASSPT
jgi:fumarylacetoacetate (FAA) hydrolase